MPAFLVALLVLALLHRPDPQDLAQVATFTANLLPSGVLSGQASFPVSWSLAIEEWFYLLLGLVLLALGTKARTLVLIWMLMIAARLLYLGTHPASTYDVAHATVLLRFDALMAGVLAARARPADLGQHQVALTWLRWIYLSGLLIGFFIWMGRPLIQHESRLFAAVFLPLNSVMLACLVMDVSRTPGWLVSLCTGWRGRLQKVVAFLSTVSYLLDLWRLELVLWLQNLNFGPRSLRLVLMVSLKLLLAWLSYRWIERPCLEWRDRRLREPPGRARTRPAGPLSGRRRADPGP